MNWYDALQVATVVILSLGGGGGIVLGLSRFLGDKWLQDWKGDIDARLQRLDAALQHRNFLLQRFAEFEVEGLTECWRAARACLPLINGTRPHDSGTELARLNTSTAQLSEAHNTLIEAIGKHEVHLTDPIVEKLDGLGRVLRLELYQIGHRKPFEDDWWEQGEKNRGEFKSLCDELLTLVRARVAALRSEAAAEAAKH
jgi:hypothetical protein